MSSANDERDAQVVGLTKELTHAQISVGNDGQEASVDKVGPTSSAHIKEAREKGWAEPPKYDYEMLQRASKPTEENVDANVPEWAANAIKYEWKEDYGDLGPEHPQLEEILFRDAHKMKRGNEIQT